MKAEATVKTENSKICRVRREVISREPGLSNTDNCGRACLFMQLMPYSFLASDWPTGMEVGGAWFKLLT